MGEFKTDKKWEEHENQFVEPILQSLLLRKANFKWDVHRATDMRIATVIGGERDGQAIRDIAVRVRRPGVFLDKRGYGSQFTVRTRRDSGAKTELAKFLDGWGDWFFYGHASILEDEPIPHWCVIDLNIFRKHERAVAVHLQDNRDGTYFNGYDINSFPDELLIGASPTLRLVLKEGIEAYDRLPIKLENLINPVLRTRHDVNQASETDINERKIVSRMRRRPFF